jgi:hypothetical protein
VWGGWWIRQGCGQWGKQGGWQQSSAVISKACLIRWVGVV